MNKREVLLSYRQSIPSNNSKQELFALLRKKIIGID